jgi:cellulose synthase/poly-beta-1,6-N-acetylglucosamine synthase-like glycosyltransferase
MTILFFFILSVYGILIIWIVSGMLKLHVFEMEETVPLISFSIIVPFRNEAENLPILISSFKALDYPKEKFEIIFINDDSEDSSVEIVNSFIKEGTFNVFLFDNQQISKAPKKDAITLGVSMANYDWIITTDADCVVSETWLKNLDGFILKLQPKLISGPVKFKTQKSFINDFQNLEFLSFQGVTMGCFGLKKPCMCSGANLAYHKSVFYEVNGFKGNNHIASGDDVFLLEKVNKAYPDGVHFLKSMSSTVVTKAEFSLLGIVQQRIRWAAKSANYTNIFTKVLGASVFLANLVIVLGLLFAFFGVLNWEYLFIGFVIKFVADTTLMYAAASFFKYHIRLSSLYFSSFLYPFFSSLLAIYALIAPFNWKGRRFKK